MKTLLWKEWHEQSWKLGFGCIVLAAMAFIGLHTRIIADMTMMMAVCFLGIGLLPVLASTGLVPAERSEGSFESLLALPIAPWRILFAKTLLGTLLCAAPLAAAAIASYLAAGSREVPTAGIFILYSRSILVALSLFIWMLALTIRLPNETRAGLLSLGILILWLMMELGMVDLLRDAIPHLALTILPFSLINFSDDHVPPPFAIVFIVQLFIAAALWIWASRRLNTFAEGKE